MTQNPCYTFGLRGWINKQILNMKREINTYKDGATVRLHNKRISFKETDTKTMISFQFAGDVEPDKPACGHKCHKGKVRDTFIQMSNEAMRRGT